ncbi:MAG: hypothetical protein WAZ18_02770 [Alphaproteobacteria bacterium]
MNQHVQPDLFQVDWLHELSQVLEAIRRTIQNSRCLNKNNPDYAFTPLLSGQLLRLFTQKEQLWARIPATHLPQVEADCTSLLAELAIIKTRINPQALTHHQETTDRRYREAHTGERTDILSEPARWALTTSNDSR